MIKVKICGLTNLEDAQKACDYGADLVGFIFIKDTPRCVENIRDIARSFTERSKDTLISVGLFKDEDPEEVADTVAYCGLDCVQLQGDETPGYCGRLKERTRDKQGVAVSIIKTFKVKGTILPSGGCVLEDYDVADYFVFDTFHPDLAGGTGEEFNWGVLSAEMHRIVKPFFIAGGLGPHNVSDGIKKARPYGVDVSSGVEKNIGKKDEDLLKEFIRNAKET